MDAHLSPYDERLKPFNPPMPHAQKTAVLASAKKFFDRCWERATRHS